MAIKLNNQTKLTTEAEKRWVELGGQDPHKTLSQDELTSALTHTIEALAEQRSPILQKIYRRYEQAGEVPPLDE